MAGMKRKRHTYSPDDKVNHLIRLLIEKVPVTDICEELGIHLTLSFNLGSPGYSELQHSALRNVGNKAAQRREQYRPTWGVFRRGPVGRSECCGQFRHPMVVIQGEAVARHNEG